MKRMTFGVAMLALFALALGAQAAPVIHKNGSNRSLTNTANWDGGALPGTGDVATWGTASDGTSLGGALSYGSTSSPSYQGIDIQSATAAITISTTGTNPLTIGSSGINIASGGVNLTFNNNLIVGASQSWNIGSGRTLLINTTGSTITFNTGTTTTLTGAGTVEFGNNRVLAGDGALIVDGATVLNSLGGGTQTRTGTTTLKSGIIRISSSVSIFGSGALNLNGGTIGSGTVTGRILSNTLNIGGSVTIGNTSGGTTSYMEFDGSTDLGGGTRAFDVYSNAVRSGYGAGFILTGVVSNGGITMNSTSGTGIMSLTNNSNTFSGAVTVNAGNLAFTYGALDTASSVALAGTAALSTASNDGIAHVINNLSGASGNTIRADFSIGGTASARILSVNQTSDGTYAGTFVEGTSGRTIALVKTGSAKLTLSNTSGYTGGTTVSAGTLALGHATDTLYNTSAVAVDGATAELSIGGNSDTVGTVTLKSGGLISGTGGTLTGSSYAFESGSVTAILGGSGIVLTKSTGGTVILSGANSYTGGTTISGGTLQIGAGSSNTARAGTGSIQVDASGAMTFNYGTALTAFANNITGSGTINKEGGAEVGLTGTNSFSGQININSNKLAFQGASSGSGTPKVYIASGATMSVGSGYANGTLTLSELTGAGTIDTAFGGSNDTRTLNVNQSTDTTFSGSMTDANNSRILVLTKSGSGKLTLSSTSTYTGGTTITAGTLALGHATNTLANTGAVTVDGGAAELSVGGNSDTVGAVTLKNGGLISGSTGTLTGSSYAVESGSISAKLGGSVALTKSTGGTVTLSGANSYTGTTTVNAGTLALSGGAAIADTGAVTLADTAGAILKLNASETIGSIAGGGTTGGNVDLGASTLTVGDANSTTYAGAMSGTGGALTKTGGGKLTLSGSNSYTGATAVNGGTLALNGTLTSAITVGAIGKLQGSGMTSGGLIISGTVAPGNSIESLGVGGNIEFNAGSTFAYEMNTTALNGDLLYTTNGNFNVTSETTYLTLADEAPGLLLSQGAKLTLISYTGTWDGGVFTYGASPVGDDTTISFSSYTWMFNYNDTSGGSNFTDDPVVGSKFVTMTVIPEPGTAGIVATFLAAALLRKRRFG